MNSFDLKGNLVGDPVINTTNTGRVKARFSVAVDYNYTDEYGNAKMRTEFVDCVAWGRTAELIGNYLCKGKRFMGEGEWASYSYTDQQGEKRRMRYIRIKEAGISLFSLEPKNNTYTEGRQAVQNAAPKAEPPAPTAFDGFGQAAPMPMDDMPY